MTDSGGRIVALRQWYVLTGAGRSAVRVKDQMPVGRGPFGELSLDPEKPLFVIHREGFGLRLVCVDRESEFEDRWDGARAVAVDIGPGCRAEILLLDTSVTLDTTLTPGSMRQNLYFSLVRRKRRLPLPLPAQKHGERMPAVAAAPLIRPAAGRPFPSWVWLLAPVLGITTGYVLWSQTDRAPSVPVGDPLVVERAPFITPERLADLVDLRFSEFDPVLDWMPARDLGPGDASCPILLPRWTMLHEVPVTEILPVVVRPPVPKPQPVRRRQPAPQIAAAPEPQPVPASPPARPQIDLQDYPFDQLTVTRRVQARYPRRAPNGAEGSVELRLTISTRGRVKRAAVEGSPPAYFRSAALRAAKRWRFEPVEIDGEVVEVVTRIRFLFVSD